MSIVNRRNAVIGWLAWTGAKFVLKQKAKAAAPRIDRETKRPNRTAIALLVASAVGVAAFWRSRAADAPTD